MKSYIFIILIVISEFSTAQIGEIIWEENFDNLDNWLIETGNGSWGWGNGELQYYSENNVEILLNSKPDVILCNSIRIHAGAPTDNTDFDCNYENYKNEYFQLDTSEYRKDLKIEYYYDPYKPLNVFIKKGYFRLLKI